VAVEEDEAAGGVGALGEELDGFAGGQHGGGVRGGGSRPRRGGTGEFSGGVAKKIDGGFGHDDFHDGFAVAGGRDAASFGVGVAAAADERGVADAAGEFAAGAAGGSGVEDRIVFEDHDGSFDGVESGAAAGENGPAGGEGAPAAGVAGVHGFVGGVPRAAVNDQRRLHRKSRMAKGIREVKEVKEAEEGKDKESFRRQPDAGKGQTKQELTQRAQRTPFGAQGKQRAQRRKKI